MKSGTTPAVLRTHRQRHKQYATAACLVTKDVVNTGTIWMIWVSKKVTEQKCKVVKVFRFFNASIECETFIFSLIFALFMFTKYYNELNTMVNNFTLHKMACHKLIFNFLHLSYVNYHLLQLVFILLFSF